MKRGSNPRTFMSAGPGRGDMLDPRQPVHLETLDRTRTSLAQYSPSPSPSPPTSNDAHHRMLVDALSDMIEHELCYAHAITTLKNVYVDSLLHDAQSPRPQLMQYTPDHIVLFATIGNLVTLHTNLARDLALRKAIYMSSRNLAISPNSTNGADSKNDKINLDSEESDVHESFAKQVAATMIRYTPMLEVYGQYASKYNTVRQTIVEAIHKQASDPVRHVQVYEFLNDAKTTGRVGDDAAGMLLSLLECAMSYVEFEEHNLSYIQAIAECSPQPSVITSYQEVAGSMRRTLEHVQGQMQIAANRDKMHAIELAWNKKFTQPGRVFVREGLLVKVSRARDIPYVFVLFSDMLMYGASTPVGNVVHHRSLSLRTLKVQDVTSFPAAFAIFSDSKSFTVKAASLQDKQEWVAAIVASVSRVTSEDIVLEGSTEACSIQQGSFSPVWKQDKDANECNLCKVEFTLLNRRHHCRRCGELVCNDCSKFRFPRNKLVARNTSSALERTCTQCAGHVLSSMDPEEARKYLEESTRSSRSSSISKRHSTTVSVNQDIVAPLLLIQCNTPSARRDSFVTEAGDETPMSPLSPCFVSKPGGQKSKRRLVIEEMLSTEKSYVDNLETINELFVLPLLADAQSSRPTFGKICEARSENNLVSMDLFLHALQQLLAVNRRLLADLLTRLSNWSDSDTIGDIFLHFAPLFDVYSQYTDAQEFASQAVFDFQDRSRDFKEFLENFERNPRVKQTIQSFLIMPIQRVPRYHLLLQECSKQTEKLDPEHEDLQLLEQALELVKDSATRINAVIHIRENRSRIFELERGWSGYRLSKKDRRLIREGFLTKQCRRSPKEFYFLLFNDVLVYGEVDLTGTFSYVHHRVLDLRACKVEEPSASSIVSNAFQIFGKEKAFVVYARDELLKAAWMRDIAAAVDALGAGTLVATDQAFAAVWVPDAHARHCTLCNIAFGLLLRKHHCRDCGRICCDSCSSRRVLLEHLHATQQLRVCDVCAVRRGLLEAGIHRANSASPISAGTSGGVLEKESFSSNTIRPDKPAPSIPCIPLEDLDSSDDDAESAQNSESDEEGDASRRIVDAVGNAISSFPARVFVMYDFYPQEDGEILARAGMTFTANDVHGDWIHLSDEAGNQGWAPRQYVSLEL